MYYPKIKYYGTLIATGFVLLLSTEHISEALKVVEKYSSNGSGIGGTWLAAAGLQIFEVLTGMGVADLIAKRKKQYVVLTLLIVILTLFFAINVFGNILYAFSNMAQTSGRELTMEIINSLDNLQIFWVLWASIPIPLMGIAGITVQAIFKLDLKDEKEIADAKAEIEEHIFTKLKQEFEVENGPGIEKIQATMNSVLDDAISAEMIDKIEPEKKN